MMLSESIIEREVEMVDLVRTKSKRVSYQWVNLDIGNIILQITTDALKIDGIRINVSAYAQQQMADLLNASLPTAKMCDLLWHYSDVKLNPSPQQISSSNESMIKHSNRVDKQIKSQKPGKITSTVGKNWVIDNRLQNPRIPNQACNYGWHFKGSSFNGNVNQSLLKNPDTKQYWRVIQPVSFYHNFRHSDYSQVCVLVSRQCWVNGEEKDLFDVLRDPTLAPLVNHDGILHVLRQPNVPVLDPIVELPIQPLPEPEPETPKEPVTILPIEVTVNPQPSEPIVAKVQEPVGIWALILWVIQMVIALFSKSKGS